MKKLGVLIAALTVLSTAMVGPVALAQITIVNGGFEASYSQGSVQDWDWNPGLGDADVVTATSFTAFDGSMISAHTGAQMALLYPGNAGSMAVLSQEFTAEAGDSISGYAVFDAEKRGSRPDVPNDWGEVVVTRAGAVIATVFRASVDPPSGIGKNTGWVPWSFAFTEPGTYRVEARVANVTDNLGDSRLAIDSLITSALPTAEAGGPYTVNEGSQVQLTGHGTAPSGSARFDWDLDGRDGFESAGQNPVYLARDGPATITVRLRVTDTISGVEAVDTATITVINVAPQVEAGLDQEINLGGMAVSTATFTDPGADTWTVQIDYGDGTPVQAFETGAKTIAVSHYYAEAGSYTFTVTVTDDDGGAGSDTARVNVVGPNVLPEFQNVIPTQQVREGGTLVVEMAARDPDHHLAVTMWISAIEKRVGDSFVNVPDHASTGIIFESLGAINDTEWYLGRLTWTPTYGQAGEYGISVRAKEAGDTGMANRSEDDLHFHIVVIDVQTYTITATGGPGGAISPEAVTLETGGSQTFTITPNPGYHVSDVLVDGVSVGAPESYTFNNVVDSHTISASFAINTYQITATAGANGSVSPPSAMVDHGNNQTFTITPDAGYHVSDVFVDGVSVGATGSYTFSNVVDSHTISASFAVNTYQITATAGLNGAISPTSATVEYGGSQTFTITPDTGYHVSDVLVDGVSAGAVGSYTFVNVQSAHTISATFDIDMFDIAATAGPNGAITPSGTVQVAYGGSQTFTVAPAKRYVVFDVVVDGVSQGAVASYTFQSVTGPHTIEASFVESPDIEAGMLIKHLSINWGKKPGDKANFEVNGRLQVPAEVILADLEMAAEVEISISNGTVTDSVIFNRGKGKDGTQWVYQSKDKLQSAGLELDKLTVWWAPDGGRWAGLAGFHIGGQFSMAGVSGSTQPPQVTVTLRIPHKDGYTVIASATVDCKVSGKDKVWQYNAHTGWPDFDYDVD